MPRTKTDTPKVQRQLAKMAKKFRSAIQVMDYSDHVNLVRAVIRMTAQFRELEHKVEGLENDIMGVDMKREEDILWESSWFTNVSFRLQRLEKHLGLKAWNDECAEEAAKARQEAAALGEK